jgi:inosine-uridine nucleoside N-ribohydrolase
LFTFKHLRVDIETASDRCAGETICDVFNMSKAEKNCDLATKVDVARFWDLMIAAIEKANAVSSMNKKN